MWTTIERNIKINWNWNHRTGPKEKTLTINLAKLNALTTIGHRLSTTVLQMEGSIFSFFYKHTVYSGGNATWCSRCCCCSCWCASICSCLILSDWLSPLSALAAPTLPPPKCATVIDRGESRLPPPPASSDSEVLPPVLGTGLDLKLPCALACKGRTRRNQQRKKKKKWEISNNELVYTLSHSSNVCYHSI